MPARLVALNGTADIVISGLLTIAGRHEACDARLCSSRVSRRHCCLALGVGEVLVRDLGSHNGTWINGQRIEAGTLRPGDVLGIAHLRFRLEPLTPAQKEDAREDLSQTSPAASEEILDTVPEHSSLSDP
jgi:pSer/pThr/pTyr-binding forkhead associated (FHA) protein